MRALVGVRDVAGHLARMHCPIAHKAEHGSGVVAGLDAELCEVNRFAVDAWRRTGFQAALRQLHFFKPSAQCCGRRIACTPGGVVLQADMDEARQKCARSQHNRCRLKRHAHLRSHARHSLSGDADVIHRLLKQGQARLILDARTDGSAVQDAVVLGASRANRRAF